MNSETAKKKLASFDTIHLINELKYRISIGEIIDIDGLVKHNNLVRDLRKIDFV